MKYAVGIDVGGTNTRVALINEEYKILERIKFSTDSKDPEVTLQKIVTSILRASTPILPILSTAARSAVSSAKTSTPQPLISRFTE